MQRIVRGRSATLTHTFYSDGSPTNPSPDSATVTITNDAGTAVVTNQATTDTGTGTVSYTVTPTQTANLDLWTVDWTATFGGQSQVFTDYVEIVGDVLFTIAEARAITPLNNTTTYPTALITTMRTRVEQALEDACGVAFVPRYRRELVSGIGTTRAVLSMPRVTAIRSTTLDGTSIGATALATLIPNLGGVVYYPTGWTAGYGNYSIAYEHGHEYPPERVRGAALLLAKEWLVQGPVDARTTTMTNEDGTYILSTPGMRGAVFGLPEVDSAVMEYSMQPQLV